jgi:hypothetical protein
LQSSEISSHQSSHGNLTGLQQQMEMIAKKGLICEGQDWTLFTILTTGLRKSEICKKIENLNTRGLNCRTVSFEAYPGQLHLFRLMAGHEMPRADFVEVGRLCAADLRHKGAAWVEVAAWRWIGGAGDLPLQLDIARLHARVGHWHGRHQGGRIKCREG